MRWGEPLCLAALGQQQKGGGSRPGACGSSTPTLTEHLKVPPDKSVGLSEPLSLRQHAKASDANWEEAGVCLGQSGPRT